MTHWIQTPRFRSLIPGLILLSLFASTGQARSDLEKTVLFTAGEGGYVSYRIPALIVSPQQTLLAACEARKDSGSDWGHIDLFFRRSVDGGKTWENPRRLIGPADLPADVANQSARTTKGDQLTINNPTWIADPSNGTTHLLFCVEYGRSFIITTPDGGKTFSKPREITAAFETFRTRDGYPWKVIAIGPGHGVRLTSGRLVAAVWLASGKGHAHRPSVCATIYSDDQGATWQAGEIVARDPDLPNPSETVVVEAAPNRIMLNIRNESPRNRRAVSWSADGATGWSQPEYVEELWEPICMGSLSKLTDGTLIFANPASLNPIPQRPQAANRQRENLGVRTSTDQGKSWSVPLILESGPSAYSDLAVAPDGSVLCFYEHGEKGPYEKMSVARIPAELLPKRQP